MSGLSSDALSAQIAERNAKMEAMKAARSARKARPAAAPQPTAAAAAAPPVATPPQPSVQLQSPPVVQVVSATPPPVELESSPVQSTPGMMNQPLAPSPSHAPPLFSAAASSEEVARAEGRIQSLESELGRLRTSEREALARVTDLQDKLASATQQKSSRENEYQDLQSVHLSAQAESRRLSFEVERLNHELETAARRFAAKAQARTREELFLWQERAAVEIEQHEARLSLAKQCESGKSVYLIRHEADAAAALLKNVNAQHDEELVKFQASLAKLEDEVRAAQDGQAKHEQLAGLAKRQLEDHVALHDREVQSLAAEKHRKQADFEKVIGERDAATALVTQAEDEASRCHRQVEALQKEAAAARQERHEALTTLSEEREDRMRALKTFKDQLFKREQEREDLLRKIPELEQSRAALEEKIRHLETVRRQNEEDIKTLRREREEAELKVGEVRQQFREKQKGDEMEIIRLLRNDRTWRLERVEMEQEIKRLSQETAVQARESLDIQKEFASLAKKTNKAQKRHREAKRDNHEMAKRLTALEQQSTNIRHLMASEVSDAKTKHRKAAQALDDEVRRLREEWEYRSRLQEKDLNTAYDAIDEKNEQITLLQTRVAELSHLEKYASGLASGTTGTTTTAVKPNANNISNTPLLSASSLYPSSAITSPDAANPARSRVKKAKPPARSDRGSVAYNDDDDDDISAYLQGPRNGGVQPQHADPSRPAVGGGGRKPRQSPAVPLRASAQMANPAPGMLDPHLSRRGRNSTSLTDASSESARKVHKKTVSPPRDTY
ncbi:hypothetical protein DIPPA_01117 [Diplonema papillatum]|nr:hypothetical protein DIPPA_01117 [Diplonema papillatum]